MDTMQLARALPGRDLATPGPWSVLYAVTLPILFGITLHLYWPDLRGGHLREPLLQWAFATPAGIATLVVGCMVLVALPGCLTGLAGTRRRLARATDMTEMRLEPPVRGRPRERPQAPRDERWLGRTAEERRASLAQLILGAALALFVVSAVVAAFVYPFTVPGHLTQCEVDSCAPLFPTLSIAIAGLYGAQVLAAILNYRLLRRVEAACGIQLRRWAIEQGAGVWYVRRHGVTADSAAAALARFAPAQGRTLAREFLLAVVGATPFFGLSAASTVLYTWLRLQWIPG